MLVLSTSAKCTLKLRENVKVVGRKHNVGLRQVLAHGPQTSTHLFSRVDLHTRKGNLEGINQCPEPLGREGLRYDGERPCTLQLHKPVLHGYNSLWKKNLQLLFGDF